MSQSFIHYLYQFLNELLKIQKKVDLVWEFKNWETNKNAIKLNIKL